MAVCQAAMVDAREALIISMGVENDLIISLTPRDGNCQFTVGAMNDGGHTTASDLRCKCHAIADSKDGRDKYRGFFTSDEDHEAWVKGIIGGADGDHITLQILAVILDCNVICIDLEKWHTLPIGEERLGRPVFYWMYDPELNGHYMHAVVASSVSDASLVTVEVRIIL